MSLSILVSIAVIIGAAISVCSLVLGLWNAYQGAVVAKMIAELHLNIRREMNGKYISVQSFQDAKDRIVRLEAEHDAS